MACDHFEYSYVALALVRQFEVQLAESWSAVVEELWNEDTRGAPSICACLNGLVAFQNRYPHARTLVMGGPSCPAERFLRDEVELFS